jgi:DNA-binding CsgD family transcriptional regulator
MSESANNWCVASIDAELRIVFADNGFSETIGLPPDRLRQRCVLDFLHPGFLRGPARALTALAQAGQGEVSDQVMLALPKGQSLPAVITALAVPVTPVSPTRIVLALSTTPHRPEAVQPVRQQQSLTLLDAQVLEGVAAGVPTTRLAKRLNLSRQGIEYHIGRMLRKFGAANRTALIAKAYSLGMLSADSWPPRVAPEFMA